MTDKRYFCAAAFVAAGMFGLYSGIQYSGWVLAVGLLIAL